MDSVRAESRAMFVDMRSPPAVDAMTTAVDTDAPTAVHTLGVSGSASGNSRRFA